MSNNTQSFGDFFWLTVFHREPLNDEKQSLYRYSTSHDRNLNLLRQIKCEVNVPIAVSQSFPSFFSFFFSKIYFNGEFYSIMINKKHPEKLPKLTVNLIEVDTFKRPSTLKTTRVFRIQPWGTIQKTPIH